jgi:hypothetical protein
VVFGEIPRSATAFQPREELMAEVRAALGGGSGVGLLCALAGLRGVGKSQLAAAYARECDRQGWEVIAWLAAETPEGLLAGLDGLAEELGVRPAEGGSPASEAAVRRFLEQSGARALVVFDNAEDPDLIRPWLPSRGPAQVLVTTNRQAMVNLAGATLVQVGVFSPSEAAAYLRKRTQLGPDPDLDAVAAELGCLPLALAQAVTVINGEGLTAGQYLSRLRATQVGALLDRSPGEDYPRGSAEAILLSIGEAERRDRSGGLVRPVLELLAVLSPDGVSRALLDQARHQGVLGEAEPVSEARLGAAVGALVEA